MNGIGTTRCQHIGLNACDELVDHRPKTLLGQVGVSGPNRHDHQVGFHRNRPGGSVTPASGVHPDDDPRLGKRRRQLSDVHVHATGVGRAGLGQR